VSSYRSAWKVMTDPAFPRQGMINLFSPDKAVVLGSDADLTMFTDALFSIVAHKGRKGPLSLWRYTSEEGQWRHVLQFHFHRVNWLPPDVMDEPLEEGEEPEEDGWIKFTVFGNAVKKGVPIEERMISGTGRLKDDSRYVNEGWARIAADLKKAARRGDFDSLSVRIMRAKGEAETGPIREIFTWMAEEPEL
jgi:hypothetical protein